MLLRYTSTICFVLSALLSIVLLSSAAQAEVSSHHVANSNSVVQKIEFGGCGFEPVDATTEVGCCEPGGTCFEKQCCSHINVSNIALVETNVRSYSSPFRYALAVSAPISYTSVEIQSLYRPPIA
ncbi:hypothetical protein [Vibrio orientalis]|uniref:hypothetical protein n=1 Tax=Vibrio orientalis TaxID=28175 RepID=UPI000592D775|nr:hypothetical protein [Vibrio orientalis]